MDVCKFQYLALMLCSGCNREHLLHRWRQLDAAARTDVHVDEDFEARRRFLTNVDTMSLDDEAAAATEEIDFHRRYRNRCNTYPYAYPISTV